LAEELRGIGAELLVLARGAGGVEERIEFLGGDLQPLDRLLRDPVTHVARLSLPFLTIDRLRRSGR
jgi:hypothetical protein